MRLSTDERPDEALAIETIAAAVAAGVTVFDTARAYGDNEQLLARALRACGGAAEARIVTKGGMTRPGGAWVPDGRAKTLIADCEASLEALDGLPIDLSLLHAPDPRTPWSTSVRALARLVDEGLVRRVGLSNVSRTQLDEALELAPVAAVQVALSVFDDSALRGGIVERCEDAGVAVIAHSPLGGPRRAGRLARNAVLSELAQAHGARPSEVALAWVLAVSPAVVAVPGARRPETARSAAAAASLSLSSEELETVARAFGLRQQPRATAASSHPDADVVLVMGIPGAGKSRIASQLTGQGYLRLNRDERGGSLRALADALDDELAAGTGRVVLDNTYLTRAARSYVLETAARHRVSVRCVWLDTPLPQAQVNLVERLIDRFGALATPEELRSLGREEAGLLLPTRQMRALRELEPPSLDEGFAAVEQVPFVREPAGDAAGVFVAAGVLAHEGWERILADGDPQAPHLLFDWRPDGDVAELKEHVARIAAVVSGQVESALCPHGAGPPACWCRPPLPGLPLAFARAHAVNPARSLLVGSSAAHKTLAATLGARYRGLG